MKTIKALKPYLQGSKALLALAFVCSLLSTGSKLLIPFLAGKAINEIGVLVNGGTFDKSYFDLLMIVSLSLVAVGALFRFFFDYLTYLVGQKVIKKMRDTLFESYQSLPLSYIDSHRKGDLLQRMINDVENVQTGLISGFATLFDGVVAILMTLVFMFTLNWALGIIVVLLTPISLLVSKKISSYNSKHFRSQAEANGKLAAELQESLSNSETVSAWGIKEDRKRAFLEANESAKHHNFKASFGVSLINPSTRLVNSIINAMLIIFGALLIINSDFSSSIGITFLVGDLSAFLAYASNYMQPFNEISDVMSEISYARSSFRRVEEANQEMKDINEGKKIIEGEIDTLEAKDIHFAYEEGKEIIKGFDLSIYKGHRIAIVGPTGCGKTTMINLLLRFYDPQQGGFMMNGIASTDIEKHALRSHIGMVLQDSWIFSGTVFENIAYGKEGATYEEVIEASKKAQAHGFIERLPQGYETKIGPNSALSKGERQLICIARVMLMKPEIVILDEATSNIDVYSESLLISSFNELMKGKTSLVVAHRLSTIVGSDLIVVMKEGKIIEQGSHKELMEKGGFYRSLYQSQFQ